MSNPVGVDQVLARLQRLSGLVRDFALREQALENGCRTKTAAERRRWSNTLDQAHTRRAEESAALESAHQAAAAAVTAEAQRRRARIDHAHKSSYKRCLESVEAAVGRRKYELQKETIQAERDRDTCILEANAQRETLLATLADDQERLAHAEALAQTAFRGYRSFRKLLTQTTGIAPDPARDADQAGEALDRLLADTAARLQRFRRLPLPAVFRFVPLGVQLFVIVTAAAVTTLLLPRLGWHPPANAAVTGGAAALALALVALHQLGRQRAGPAARKIAQALATGRLWHQECLEKCETRHQQTLERAVADLRDRVAELDRHWKEAVVEGNRMRDAGPQWIQEKFARVLVAHERHHARQRDTVNREHAAAAGRLQRETAGELERLTAAREAALAKLTADWQAEWRGLEQEWRRQVQPIHGALQAANAEAGRLFPDWNDSFVAKWEPPAAFAHAAPFGRITVDVPRLAEVTPRDPRLAWPGTSPFAVSALLTYPHAGSLLLETAQTGRETALATLDHLVLRLLAVAPPGRLNFTIFDPVGLGQSFAGIMHLADYEEHLISSRIWTQSSQFEQKLADLNEHMEKVIQMYLRNVYDTIVEYNEEAGNIAEKYHFLVVADFPVNFTDAAARRLLKIAASGAKCGVYTLIHWDRRHPLPADFIPDELRRSSVCLTAGADSFLIAGQPPSGTRLQLDAPPPPDLATNFVHKVGQRSKDSNRVEVPFSHVAPPDDAWWTGDTTTELRVPVGRTGATKLQYLEIGRGTRQHALLAGKTGSGKSTLFHVIITNLALWCSPDQVEFYLVDFKKGVEFKCYAAKHLPHARVVAIESDREFGLSVLQRVDDELRRRGDLFRRLGVQDLAGYKKAGGTEPVPRSLLIIDEFQEFFVEDDRIAQSASVLLDRIVRQGRAFGIHVLLGSQTLGGAYTLARTTLGQMVIRIALQCNEADAYLIMDENNPAPRLLSRPGEGIYNDTAGSVEGNSPFQVVWLPDEERDGYLEKVRAVAAARLPSPESPIVFEGNAPAEVADNPVLRSLLTAPTLPAAATPRIWLGAPNSIKGPTEAVFHRQSGNHLLLVGQREEAILGSLSIALVSLAAQFPPDGVRLIVLDGNPPDSPPRLFLERIVATLPHPVRLVKGADLAEALGELTAELQRRTEEVAAADAPPVFLLIHGMQKFHKLRQDDDLGFSLDDSAAAKPAALLNRLVCEGAKVGIHLIASIDSYNNVNRFLGRKALSEFELRVLFQMSANDSASLIDSPKAGNLGLHRALFFNAQEGTLETFRPYALPRSEWLAQVARDLTRLCG